MRVSVCVCVCGPSDGLNTALCPPSTRYARNPMHTHTPWASFTFSDASHASQIPFADLGRAWSRFGHDALAIPAPYLHGENQPYVERTICAFARVQACTTRINCHRFKISALMWRSSSSSMQRSASWSNVASAVIKSAMPIFGAIRTCIVVGARRRTVSFWCTRMCCLSNCAQRTCSAIPICAPARGRQAGRQVRMHACTHARMHVSARTRRTRTHAGSQRSASARYPAFH
jgi:hypothetical protein